jgi:hypothetical protein
MTEKMTRAQLIAHVARAKGTVDVLLGQPLYADVAEELGYARDHLDAAIRIIEDDDG